MADASPESEIWVRRLVVGEEQMVEESWARYGASLQRLAKSRMTPALQQPVDAEDEVQSVCHTFSAARKQQFDLPGSDALWRLLCAITLTKVRRHARFHFLTLTARAYCTGKIVAAFASPSFRAAWYGQYGSRSISLASITRSAC